MQSRAYYTVYNNENIGIPCVAYGTVVVLEHMVIREAQVYYMFSVQDQIHQPRRTGP